MRIFTLSKPALDVIQNYLHLPFPDHDINCPYFNNQRVKVHAGLRALIGKGSVEDIIEEANIIALRDKINLSALTNDELKKFLVNNNIGLDCSAIVYYVLAAELQARGLAPLKKLLKFPFAKSLIRQLLAKLRPVENVEVNTLAHEANSREVLLSDVQPGDMIIMLKTGQKHNLNHVLLIHQVNNLNSVMHYTHSFKWRTDGKYNHGIRQGAITIVDPTKTLLYQIWEEEGKQSEENGTFMEAKEALSLSIKRLNFLNNLSTIPT